MSTEENKKIVLEALENLSKRNGDAIIKVLAKNATQWVPGNIPGMSGTWNREVMDKIFSNLGVFFPKGIKITVDNVIAEGDYVAVEGHSYAELAGKNYKDYRNYYHWSFKVRDGKIEAWREYLDTVVLQEALGHLSLAGLPG